MSGKLMTAGSRGEVAELTGARTRRRQIATLVRNGMPHIINAAGWPVVAWAAIDGSGKQAKPEKQAWRSNKAA